MGKNENILKLFTKICLFLSSFSFLFLILSIQNFDIKWFFWMNISLVILPTVIVLLFFFKGRSTADKFLNISNISNSNSENLSYLFSYIFPFLGLDYAKIVDLVILLILIVMVAIIYIKSDILYINPLLNILGFNIFKAEIEKKKSVFIISRNSDFDELKKKRYKSFSSTLFIEEK